MNIIFLISIIQLSLKSIRLNKMRSILTVLGIIFGTGSVIAMMSISGGAKQEALAQIEKLGSRNIIILSRKPPEKKTDTSNVSRISEYGLTALDKTVIQNSLEIIETIIPVRDVKQNALYQGRRFYGNILATYPDYIELSGIRIQKGRFLTDFDIKQYRRVCVIGDLVKRQMFGLNECIGKQIKVGGKYFVIIGVLEPVSSKKGDVALVSQDANRDIYLPFTTANNVYGATIFKRQSGSFEAEKVEYHGLYIKVNSIENVLPAAEIIRAILKENHKEEDYEIIVPLHLLAQREKTQRTFNIIMISIAGISLLVGGIGIMNIMLATVTERTREIGIRRSLGATKQDITFQFLIEAMVLSGIGGLIGIIAGITGAFFVTYFAGWVTILTPVSILLCFLVSVSIGIIFGLYPATKAAEMNPVEALRYE